MTGFNPLPHPGLAKEYPQAYIAMGQTAENIARKYQITREQQQALAVESHQKAAAAQAAGKLKDEIVPIKGKDGGIDQDGCIRPDTTQQTLSGLAPAFDAEWDPAATALRGKLILDALAVQVVAAPRLASPWEGWGDAAV